ncbi:TetR/AcrR family transcriptional regulator [Burkholderia sp. Ac-20379]|uniref:TetR/AcrR family transcriptional regulator n=1 Tax=Burkholderia sp. Ac-20379 TaxID=2703900 RepID=UPI00197D3928|nr:TetR/AcrR family transcriptional regulator [Burkholderia sp. Ac-20379]MBN3723888.1 TetR/AcrR family transcriptional regulator [Burkholderia sp. Ac-20379]
MDETDVEDNVRGSADMWLDAATESLLEGGVEAVRILPLAKKLNLSRTSFYWFFENREALLATLLQRWQEKNTVNWVSQTSAYADSIAEAVLNVFDCWFDDSIFDNRYEAAIRSWGQQAPEIAAVMAKEDATRIAALTTMFKRFDYSPLEADVRARAMYLTQIGYVSMRTVEPMSVRMSRIAQYVVVFAGHEPTEREMKRFTSRLPAKGKRGKSAG